MSGGSRQRSCAGSPCGRKGEEARPGRYAARGRTWDSMAAPAVRRTPAELVIGLKGEPELGGNPEVFPQPECGIRGDGAHAIYDGADPVRRHLQVTMPMRVEGKGTTGSPFGLKSSGPSGDGLGRGVIGTGGAKGERRVIGHEPRAPAWAARALRVGSLPAGSCVRPGRLPLGGTFLRVPPPLFGQVDDAPALHHVHGSPCAPAEHPGPASGSAQGNFGREKVGVL